MNYLYYITPEVKVAETQVNCQGFACFNKIEVGQVYYFATTDLVYNNLVVKQNLCAKCVQKWFEEKIKSLESEKLEYKSDLGKAQMLASEYYGAI